MFYGQKTNLPCSNFVRPGRKKYIPITKESLPNHLNGAKNALLIYVAEPIKQALLMVNIFLFKAAQY